MGHEEELDAYRSQLLESLNSRPDRFVACRILYRSMSMSGVLGSLKAQGSVQHCKSSASITSRRYSFAPKMERS